MSEDRPSAESLERARVALLLSEREARTTSKGTVARVAREIDAAVSAQHNKTLDAAVWVLRQFAISLKSELQAACYHNAADRVAALRACHAETPAPPSICANDGPNPCPCACHVKAETPAPPTEKEKRIHACGWASNGHCRCKMCELVGCGTCRSARPSAPASEPPTPSERTAYDRQLNEHIANGSWEPATPSEPEKEIKR